jgi:hypothetical protein
MNEGMFDVDLTMIRGLEAIYRKTPKFFAKATGDMLNNFAFGTRVEAFYEIASRMTVRNPGFVSSRLQVTKSKRSLPVASQVSFMGSVAINAGKTKSTGKSHGGFTGWAEQQLGTRSTRERTASLLSRMGSPARQMTGPSRLKPSNVFLSYADFRIRKGANPELQTIVMLQMLSRAHYTKPFFISRKKQGMTPGLYKFKGGHPKLLQAFVTPEQPKHVPWLTNARTRYFRDTDIKRLWHKTFERELQYAGWRRLR